MNWSSTEIGRRKSVACVRLRTNTLLLVHGPSEHLIPLTVNIKIITRPILRCAKMILISEAELVKISLLLFYLFYLLQLSPF